MHSKRSFIVEDLRKAQLANLLTQGKRLDGRSLLDYRDLKIETNLISKAEGSAKVSLGNTQAIAGVKVEIDEPFPDTPDQGILIVNAEILPLASPYAEPGPPDEEAIELARVVDRGIRASDMINLKNLCLIEGKKVYTIFVDVSILNVDGNLFDATSYAVVSSLLTTKIPKYEVKDGEIKQVDEKISLSFDTIPISVTLGKIGNTLIVDPDQEEEALMDARLTLAVDSDDNIVAGQKGGAGSFSYDEVIRATEIARLKGKEIRSKIKEVLGIG
ncbi:MAG: exosome complex protein Rrp42 [Nitrososphaerales archaeon]